MDVSLEQFNKYLEAKAPEKPCPECGATHYNVVGKPSGEGPPLVSKMFFIAEGGGAYATYSMSCTNCGFTKSYNASTVDAWIRENG